jgi:hypothetical protein
MQKKQSEAFCCGLSGNVSSVSPDPTFARLLDQYRMFRFDDTKLIKPTPETLQTKRVFMCR